MHLQSVAMAKLSSTYLIDASFMLLQEWSPLFTRNSSRASQAGRRTFALKRSWVSQTTTVKTLALAARIVRLLHNLMVTIITDKALFQKRTTLMSSLAPGMLVCFVLQSLLGSLKTVLQSYQGIIGSAANTFSQDVSAHTVHPKLSHHTDKAMLCSWYVTSVSQWHHVIASGASTLEEQGDAVQESAAVRVATLAVTLLAAYAVHSAGDKEMKIRTLTTATWRVSSFCYDVSANQVADVCSNTVLKHMCK